MRLFSPVAVKRERNSIIVKKPMWIQNVKNPFIWILLNIISLCRPYYIWTGAQTCFMSISNKSHLLLSRINVSLYVWLFRAFCSNAKRTRRYFSWMPSVHFLTGDEGRGWVEWVEPGPCVRGTRAFPVRYGVLYTRGHSVRLGTLYGVG